MVTWVSSQTGVPSGQKARSTASERCGVSWTCWAPGGPSAKFSSEASRKKMKDWLRRSTSGASAGSRRQPVAQGLHRQIVAGEGAALMKHRTDRGVGQPALGGIGEADDGAVIHRHPAGTLDVDEEGVNRRIDKEQLETTAVEDAVDLGAAEIGVRHARDIAAVTQAKFRLGLGVEGDEIGGLAIDRDLIGPVAAAAAASGCFVIAGEQALRPGAVVDPEGYELGLDETAHGIVVNGLGKVGGGAAGSLPVGEGVPAKRGARTKPPPADIGSVEVTTQRGGGAGGRMVAPALDHREGERRQADLRRGGGGRRRHEKQGGEQQAAPQDAAGRHATPSVETSRQLGSREATSRSKVQTSVIRRTLAASPSITRRRGCGWRRSGRK